MPTTNGDASAVLVQDVTKKSLLDLFGQDLKRTERHIRLVANYIQKDAKLRMCTRASIEQAMIDAAKTRLDVGTPEKFAFIIPYGNEAKFAMSYVGMIKCLKETGACMSVFAELWCKNDKMVGGWRPGHSPRHSIVDPNNRGEMVAVYAIAKMTNGVEEREMMNVDDIKQVRKAAASDSPAWKYYEGQMVKKSVIRRLCNRLWGDVSDQGMKPEQAERLRAMLEIENRDYQFENGGNHVDASSTTLDDLADEIPAHEPPRKAPPPPPPPVAKAAPKPEPPKPAPPEEVVVEAVEAEVVEVETPAAPQYINETMQVQLERYILAGGIRVSEFPDAVKIATDGKTDRLDQILMADFDLARARIEQMVKDRRESAKKKSS